MYIYIYNIYRERAGEVEREKNKNTNKNKKKKKKNIKQIPKTTVIETKDEIKSKTKQQPQQQTTAATYNENKKIAQPKTPSDIYNKLSRGKGL